MGRFEEALGALDTLSRLNPNRMPREYGDALRGGYAERGVQGFWEAELQWHFAHVQDEGALAYLEMALACAQLGRVDEAFEHINRMIESRHPMAPQIFTNLFFAPLRSDPRFAEIRRKLGLG
jgi:hypothetical protein